MARTRTAPAQRLAAAEKRRIDRLREGLVEWYATAGRSFPWRRPDAPDFEKICVEVLLQRTRAETVSRMYGAFFARYRGWHDLADEATKRLEAQLKPIGLWQRRARSMQGLARYASATHGRFPGNEPELAKVPAVGQYVANAIRLFQHGQRFPLLDVNMARVLERYLRPRRLADIRYDPWLQAAAHWLVRKGDPAIVNWSMLDFAATVCIARTPRCDKCIFKRGCNWARRQQPPGKATGRKAKQRDGVRRAARKNPSH